NLPSRDRTAPKNQTSLPSPKAANPVGGAPAMKRHVFKVGAFFFVSAVLLTPNTATSQSPVASFSYDERGNVVRQERDTNGDGKMDRWTYYDRQGQIERV